MRLKLSLDSPAIHWKGPNQTPPDRCSFCDAPIGQDDTPLSMWTTDGFCASFCDACVDQHVEMEQRA